jgi:hypothetical protein
MPRKSQGWTLTKREDRGGIYYARFWHQGEPYNKSTGERDRGKAQKRAAEIHAEVVAGKQQRVTTRRDLSTDVGEWLESIEGVKSQGDWDRCECAWRVHLLPFFRCYERITEASVEDYTTARLKKVIRETVKKELSVLRRFVKWASKKGRDYMEPVAIPEPPADSKGTPKLKGRDWTKLERHETLALYKHLPERSPRGRHPIKSFLILGGELGIRREMLDKLSVPEHYKRGDNDLRITAAIDKQGKARDLELPPLAREALEAVAPDVGLIFPGEISYLKEMRKAALAAGIDEERATYLTLRDLRHAALSEVAKHTKSLHAVAAVAGHKDLRTTSRYFHADKHEADQALRKRAAADREIAGPVSGPVSGLVRPLASLAGPNKTGANTGNGDDPKNPGSPPEAEVAGSNPSASATFMVRACQECGEKDRPRGS